ncbi:glycosyltransferase family 39 protein [Oleiagrimonas sp. C23AA]|uniref:glycosyltransferase family 39 protein n=1 Tax=Oleiagrimonas sp. C23AA TaxID=2719047 RepID=UPI0014218764|nr:phospholipid carrier-dependent glycosyltransferase [Oleiagrimonas sp. C23AA]
MNRPAPLTKARGLVLDSARTELILASLFALFVLGIGIGLRDPWPSDEPRFALVAHWMVQHGQWLFPHRGHELYSDKPPVFMWLEAIFYLVTRNWRVAFLLPSLLAALMTLGLVYDLGRRLWSHRAGLAAALVTLLTVHFTYQMRDAQIDPLMVGWMTLANYGLLRHLLLGPSWRWFAVGCFVAGVGVITKGVGVLALLMLVPYLFARRRHWRQLAPIAAGGWRWAGCLTLFLVPILAWALPVLLVSHADGDPQHAAYVRDIFLGQTVKRYATPSGHHHGPFYFLGIIAADWLPLSLALPWALPAWWRRFRRHDARYLLPLGWALLALIFFSISGGKRDVYILPLLPMVAVGLAPLIAGLLKKRLLRALIWTLTFALGAVMLVAGVLAITRHPHWAQRMEASLDPRMWTVLATMGAAGVLAALIFRVRRAHLAWAAFATVLWTLYGTWGYSLLNGDRSAADVMAKARQVAGPGITIGLVSWKEQNLLMAQGPVTEFGFTQPPDDQYAAAVRWMDQAPTSRRVFILESSMGDCVLRDRAHFLGRANRRNWWLFGADAVRPGCVPHARADDDDQ